MLQSILITIIGFVCTGLIANWLLQKWQHENWVRQQYIGAADRDLQRLLSLNDEIVELASRRLWAMRNIIKSFNSLDSDRRALLYSEYHSVKGEWNEKILIFYARLSIDATYNLSLDLDNMIQNRFVITNSKIESIRKNDSVPTGLLGEIDSDLNEISGWILYFSKSMLNYYNREKLKFLVDENSLLDSGSLEKASTWDLFVSLFIFRKEGYRIKRSPFDFRFPGG